MNPTLEKKNGGKKLKPLVRNVILIDLVVLSAVQLAANNGGMASGTSEIITFIGFVVMMIALGIQFEQISLSHLYVGANFTQLKQELTTPQPAQPKKKKKTDAQPDESQTAAPQDEVQQETQEIAQEDVQEDAQQEEEK